MRLNTRLAALEAAMRALAKPVGTDGTRPVITITQVQADQVADIILSCGGPTAWAMSTANAEGQVSDEVAAHLRGLGFTQELQASGRLWWVLSPEAEAEFMQAWLELADAQGRAVMRRQGIEAWMQLRQGKPATPHTEAHSEAVEAASAPVADDGTLRSLWGEEHVIGADESRAKAMREALRDTSAPTNDEIREAHIRRQSRQSRRGNR